MKNEDLKALLDKIKTLNIFTDQMTLSKQMTLYGIKENYIIKILLEIIL